MSQLTARQSQVPVDNAVASRIHPASTAATSAPTTGATATQVRATPSNHEPVITKHSDCRFAGIDDLIDRVTPRADPRDDDRLFKRLLADLRTEHGELGLTGEALLAGLAHDILQATRVRLAIERLQHRDDIERREQKAYELRRQAIEDDLAVGNLITFLDHGLPLMCPTDVAPRITTLIALTLKQYVHAFTVDILTPEELETLEPVDQDIERSRQSRWAHIMPAISSLRSNRHLLELITGSTEPDDSERAALGALMEDVSEILFDRRKNLDAQKLVDRYESAPHSELLGDIEDLKRLALLDGWLRQIERAVERATKQIKQIGKRSR